MKSAEERLQAAQQGDMEAFAELFEELRPVVYAVATRLVGPDEAGDVVMNAFLKAWHALPAFRRGASLKTWLFRIVSNCALDCLRARARRREEPLNHEIGDEGGGGLLTAVETIDSPDSFTDRSDIVGIVRKAMQELSNEHRVALELRYVDGLSYAEIAAATGVSIGTVMSRLFYAKRRLRSVVEKLAK